MRNRGADRPQRSAGGEQHGGEIHHPGEEDHVLPCGGDGAAAGGEQLRQFLQGVRQVDDVGGLSRDIARAGDGDAHGGGRERGSVVDTVARHRDGAALREKLVNAIQLLLG